MKVHITQSNKMGHISIESFVKNKLMSYTSIYLVL